MNLLPFAGAGIGNGPALVNVRRHATAKNMVNHVLTRAGAGIRPLTGLVYESRFEGSRTVARAGEALL